MLPSMKPNQRSTQSMGLKIELSSHSHDTAARDTGVVHGRSTQKRTIHLPLKSLTSSDARVCAIRTISTMEIPVNMMVFQKDVQNTRDDRMVLHWRRPTKSKLGFPVVTSLKLKRIARKNGKATRPMM